MRVYQVNASVNPTNLEKAYIFADNSWADGQQHIYEGSERYNLGESLQALYQADGFVGSTAWHYAPQGIYNTPNNQMYLEVLKPMFENYLSNVIGFKPLNFTVPTGETINYTTAVIDDKVANANTVFGSSNVACVNNTLGSSPFSFSINANEDRIAFTFEVLSEDMIQDGKLALTTDGYHTTVTVFFTGNIPAYGSYFTVSVRNYNYEHIPQSWVDALYNNSDLDPTDDDPYTGDGGTDDESGTGGGGEGSDQDNYDPDSDPNPVPGLPTISAVDTGFITLYNPTAAELRNLATYLWSGLFDIETFRKIVADPMDAILGLSIVPVNVPSAGSAIVTVGNISTGISLTKASAQYIEVDCGTLKVSEKWHAYMDYSPYTKINVFLPYIGSHELNIDEVQGTTLGVKYHIDILSGACVAFITANGRVIYEFSGQCSVSIPITSVDFTQTIMALGQLAASGASFVATGGLTAPVNAASIAGAVTAAANTLGTVASGKPRVQQSGNMSGSNGLLGIQKPYIFMDRPRLCIPGQQNAYAGYPSYITYTLGNLSGFTQVINIKLNGIPCTDAERDEILTLLRGGVIL